jgi:hypothetical protein
MEICLRQRRPWEEGIYGQDFHIQDFWAMGFKVLGFSNYGVVQVLKLWSMDFGVELFKSKLFWKYFLKFFFKDWANDEMVRVCRISQNLKANTNNDQANIKSDHHEKMDVCQKVKSL